MVSFALVASLSLIILPATGAEAATGTYYLKGTGVPKADLSTAAPTSGSLPNHDPGEDSDPGRILKKSDEGWSENDADKYQLWVAPNGEMAINGQVTLTFWSAMKDFEDDKGGRVEAFLLDCNSGGSCVLIDQGTRESNPWSPSGSWVSNTIDFGSVTYSIASNRSLAIKVVVGDDSEDDMWFAYDTTAFPSRLSLQTVAPTTTTTTTTTIAAAPTTTVPTATPPPPGPTTTVAPIGETTSTTTPETGGSSTTLAIASPSGPGPGSSESSPVGGGAGAAMPDRLVTPIDPQFGDVEDPALAGVGAADEELSSTRTGNWTGSIIKGLELVIPPWAAGIIASPFMIVGFVLEAMTDSGKAIMLPMTLLIAGMVWVVLENRVFTLALIRRAEDDEGGL